MKLMLITYNLYKCLDLPSQNLKIVVTLLSYFFKVAKNKTSPKKAKATSTVQTKRMKTKVKARMEVVSLDKILKDVKVRRLRLMQITYNLYKCLNIVIFFSK